MRSSTFREYWTIAFWTLFLCWLSVAILAMDHFHGGVLTNYVADLTFPPWFYIYIRGLTREKNTIPRLLFFGTWFGRSPERASISIFIVGVLTELKTYYWPGGLITGTYDPFDILANAAGLAACYFFDKLILNQYNTK